MPDPRPTPLWRNLSFTLMWTSTAASGFGDRMIMLGAWALMGGMITGADNSTAIQAGTQFWFFLPYIFISIPGGWLADHLPRKWLLLSCDEARGLLLLAAFFAVAQASGPADIPQSHHWKVLLALFAIGSFAAIFNPTRNAIIPQIIPSRQLQSGNAVILVINVVASMIGMLVGGYIIKADQATSVRNGLLMGSLFYLVSGTFFAFLRPVAGHVVKERRQPRSFWQAMKYTGRHRKVMILIGVGVLVWSSAAAVSSGVPGVAKGHYGLEADALKDAFTTISAVLGAGMLAGAAVVVLIGTRRESTAVMMLGLICAGVCILLFSLVPWRPMTYASAFLIGVFGNIVIITTLTMLQTVSPNYIRGRVMGINGMVNTIFSVSTYFAIWQLPNADANIVRVMYGLGPLLTLAGLYGLLRHMRSGPVERPGTNFFWRLNRIHCLLLHRVHHIGRHNVPNDGPVILASNHTTALDPFLIQAGCRRKVRWVMLTSFLFWYARPLWKAIEPIGLDKDASDAMKLRKIVRELKTGQLVGMFPEGGLQRRVRQLQPFEPGVAVMARLAGAAIVPVWVHGAPRCDSILLHLMRPSRTTVVFGQPFTPDRDAEPEAVMDELRRRMTALREHVPEDRICYQPV